MYENSQNYTKNNTVSYFGKKSCPVSKITDEDLRLAGWDEGLDFAKWLAEEEYWTPDEVKRTSKFENLTNFYSVNELVEIWGLENDLKKEALRDRYVQASNRKQDCKIYEDCKVEYTEWTGSRNYPKATKRVETGAIVKVKGKSAKIILKNGDVITKRLSTNGFTFTENWTEKNRSEEKKITAAVTRFRKFSKGKSFIKVCWHKYIKTKKENLVINFKAMNINSITKDEIIELLRKSEGYFAERTVDQLENKLDVVRLGEHIGLITTSGRNN